VAAARYCVLAVPTVGTYSIIICRRACTKAGAGDFDIALLPFLTEAWARHDRDFVHAFVFLAVAVDGAELFSRGLLIGPTSASRALAAGNDGRAVSRFNHTVSWRRNAVESVHSGRASGFFVFHLFIFCTDICRWLLIIIFVSRGLSFLSGSIYDKYFI